MKNNYLYRNLLTNSVLWCGMLGLSACGASPTSIVTKSPADSSSNLESIESKYQRQYGDADALGLKRLEKTFYSSEKLSTEFGISASGDTVQQSITMTSDSLDAQKSFMQGVRPSHVETFQQGSSGTLGQDNFTQQGQSQGVLDILIVVDDSGSMTEEQQNLSSKLSPLLSYVSNSDWKIAVNTTDPGRGSLRAVIQKGDQNAEANFASAVNAGISGSGNERGILQAVNGLTALSNNTSWLRANSTLAVLIVSDEDNCSNGVGCGTDSHASGDYLLNHLSSVRALGVNARVYGLVWHSSQAKSDCSTAANVATIYSDVIARSNGTWGSVCSNDYTQTLTAISQNLSVILQTQFVLSHAPILGTEKVFVNGQLITSGYTISSNVIQFTTAPANGSAIKVEYQHSPQPMSDRFYLSKSALSSSISVQLDGQQAAASSYTYDTNSQSIVFTGGAPKVSSIRVNYKESIALNKEFDLGSKNMVMGSVVVKVNGSTINNFTVDYSRGVLIFSAEPVEAAKIDVIFQVHGNPILAYNLAIDGTNAGLVVKDAVSQALVDYRLDGYRIVFESKDFSQGRKLVLSFRNSSGNQNVVRLIESPLSGSLIVSNQAGLCSSYSLQGSDLDFSSCLGNGEVKVKYNYNTDKISEFEFKEAESIRDAVQEWSIFVNGQKLDVKSYVRKANKLTFDNLPDYAEVKIEVKYFFSSK